MTSQNYYNLQFLFKYVLYVNCTFKTSHDINKNVEIRS